MKNNVAVNPEKPERPLVDKRLDDQMTSAGRNIQW